MRQKMLLSVLAAAITLAFAATLPVAVQAAGASKPGSPGGNFYRYRNAQGVLVMERSMPPEYASKGYQIVNMQGQVVQDVPAVDEAARKAQEKGDVLSVRRDAELRKLYSAPQDAERLRDRQIESLKLKVEQSRGQLSQAANRRKTEVEQAARLERAGKPVPPHVKEGIDRVTRQVTDLEQQIKSDEDEQVRLRAEFEPIIERLKVIYPDKAGPAVAASTPAAQPALSAIAQANAAKAAADKAAAEKAAADKAAAEKAAADKAAAIKAAADKAAADRAAAAKAAADKIAADKAAAAKAVADQKAAAAKAIADKAAAEKMAAENLAAAKAAAKSMAAEKAAADKAAAEKARAKAAEKPSKAALEEEKRSAGGLRPTGF